MVQALVIAAGRGSRLGKVTGGLPKPLVPVLGVPIIDRIVAGLRAVGVTDVVVTVGIGGDHIRRHLGDGQRLGVRVRYATNTDVNGGNTRSVLAAGDLLADEFLLVMGDHLVDERILTAMLDQEVSGSVLLAVDRQNGGPGATRVLDEDGRIIEIGKDIEAWTATDTGVFRCKQDFLAALAKFVASGAEELADAVSQMDAYTFDIAAIDSYVPKLRKPVRPWWVDIDTPADLATAQAVLIDQAAKNASDAIAHWVHRPIENALVRQIAGRSRITPNQLSGAVNVGAYTVTALYASGHLLAGSLLSFVVGLADGLDGKLARVKHQVSRVGSLEHPFDMLYEFSWIVALGWAVHRQEQTAAPLLLAGIIVAVTAFYRSVYDQFGKQAGRSLDDAAPFDRHFRRIAGRRNLYNVWIVAAILAGVPLAALWAVSIHAVLTAGIYVLRAVTLLRRLDRHPPAPVHPKPSRVAP